MFLTLQIFLTTAYLLVFAAVLHNVGALLIVNAVALVVGWMVIAGVLGFVVLQTAGLVITLRKQRHESDRV